VIWHSSFVPLFQRQLGAFLWPRPELVARNDSRAGVPAQQRVVIARRADFLRLLEPRQRLAEQFKGVKAGAGSAVVQLSLGFAFANDSGVIRSLVFVVQQRQQVLRLGVAHAVALDEPVGQRQQEDDQRMLI